MVTKTEYPKKVNYQEYEHSFSYDLLKDFEEGRLDGFDMETMRGLIYGYTFTKEYAMGIIPEAFSMEYWANKKDVPIREKYEHLNLFCTCAQEQLICDAINSTGEGLSKNKPFCVICVEQEYEFLKRAWPMKIIRQSLLPGNIDCFDLEGDYSQEIYFDISRWFERKNIRDDLRSSFEDG